jgi:hypothetical protein
MGSKETKCESVNCIRLNCGTVRQRAFVISGMKVSIPLFVFSNEIRSFKLIHQLAYFTTHYNTLIGKSKLRPRTGREGPEGEKRYSSLSSALDRGGWSTPRPGCCTPGKKDPVPIVQEAGCAQGTVWTGAENLAPTRFRSPDLPTRSGSLHRLSYPSQHYGDWAYK